MSAPLLAFMAALSSVTFFARWRRQGTREALALAIFSAAAMLALTAP